MKEKTKNVLTIVLKALSYLITVALGAIGGASM